MAVPMLRGILSLRGLFIGLAILLLLGGVFLFALPAAFSSGSLRTDFARQLSRVSGADITLNGPVRFSVFPRFGIVAQDVAVATDDIALSVKETVASVYLRPLLSGRVQIKGFSLTEPEIVLRQTVNEEASADGAQTATAQGGDVFANAAVMLQRLSLDRFSLVGGRVSSEAAQGVDELVSNLDIEMSMPDIAQPISVAFSGMMDGRQVRFSGDLASLEQLLAREPSAFTLDLKLDPPPHPALADLTASGDLQFAEGGSYRIGNGKAETLGQPIQLAGSYRPGEKPYVSLALRAEELDFDALQSQEQPAQKNAQAAKQDRAPEVVGDEPDGSAMAPLADLNGDFRLEIGSLNVAGAQASGVVFAGVLENGQLDATMDASEIAGGVISARLLAALGETQPVFQGSFTADSVSLGGLARIAGTDFPGQARFDSDLQYAFQGISEAALRRSLNVAGTLRLSDGRLEIAELASLGGESATTISDLALTAKIQNIETPVSLNGKLAWNGENVGFDARISALELLSGKNSTNAAISVRSRPVSVQFKGSVGLDGVANGDTKVSAQSLKRLLVWFGQNADVPAGPFSYGGRLSAGKDRYSFENANISFNGMKASGSGSLDLGERLSIRSDLSFGDLDLAAFTRGDARADPAGNGARPKPGNRNADTPFDLTFLRSLDADIDLRANILRFGDVKAGPVATRVTIKDGRARLQLPQTGFYGGMVEADISADGSSEEAAIAVIANLKGVDALELFRDAAAFERIEGKLNASLTTGGKGNSSKRLARSLEGNTEIRFQDGAIKGIDVASVLNNLRDVMAGGFQESSAEKTEFTELGMSMNIAGGIAKTDDIRLLGPLVRMDGSGQVDLAEETIDMRLNPRVVGSLSGQGSEFDMAGLSMPVIIEGPLAAPKIYPDLTSLLKDPNASLQALSQLGLKIKGLDGGNVDLGRLARENLGGNGDIVGSLLNQVTGGNPARPAPAQQQGQPKIRDVEADLERFGIPIPSPSPRKTASVNQQQNEAQPAAQRKPASQQLVDSVAPNLPSSIDREAAGQVLDGLLNRLNQQ